jgi:hypothetical protein
MLLGVALAAALAAAPTDEAVKAAAREVLSDERYQRTLPMVGDGPLDDEELSWLRWLGAVLNVPAHVAVAVAWVGGGVALLFILLAVLSRLPSLRHRQRSNPAAATPELAALLGPREKAEVLAAAGRYAEAIHALLFEALDALLRSGGPVPLGRTSRELWRSARLEGRAREALGALIGAVERHHFGGTPATERDYLDCRALLAQYASAGGSTP